MKLIKMQNIIKSRFIDKNDQHYPGDVLHIFAKNAPVTRQHNNQLEHIPGELVKLQAKDKLPQNCDISDAKQTQNRKLPETGGLSYFLELKINAMVTLTTSITTED